MRKLPKGWRTGIVEDLFEVQLGKMLNEKTKAKDSHAPYLTNFNVQWGRFKLQNLKTMPFSNREREKFTLKSGDLIVCEGGEVGRCAIWRDEVVPCFFQKALHRLRPKNGELLPEFMLAYMRSIAGTKRLSDLTSQSSIAHLTRERFVELEVIIPPLPEQRRISDILNSADEELEKVDALILAKEQRKTGLIRGLTSASKRFPAFDAPWVKLQMSEVLARVFRPIQWNKNLALSLVSLRRRCGGLFRRPEVLAEDYKTQDLHELRANDFLISKRQVVHGAWALVSPEFSGSHVSKEYAILVNTAPKRLYMPFFAWLAQTPRMIHQARVASTGVHIEKLIFDPEVFLSEHIYLPPTIEEQRQIADFLNACEEELRLLRAQRAALDQQKRGLMQRLLTGKLRTNTSER